MVLGRASGRLPCCRELTLAPLFTLSYNIISFRPHYYMITVHRQAPVIVLVMSENVNSPRVPLPGKHGKCSPSGCRFFTNRSPQTASCLLEHVLRFLKGVLDDDVLQNKKREKENAKSDEYMPHGFLILRRHDLWAGRGRQSSQSRAFREPLTRQKSLEFNAISKRCGVAHYCLSKGLLIDIRICKRQRGSKLLFIEHLRHS